MKILFLFLISVPLFGKGLFLKDPKAAFEQAKNQKKNILIDFYGIWCPPCNELDETVFETSRFIQAAKKNFILLKVDADAKDSWELKSLYKVGGYPTLLFLNSSRDEIYRVAGYRSLDEMIRILGFVTNLKGKGYQDSCLQNDIESLWQCFQVCRERKNDSCVALTIPKLEGLVKTGTFRYEELRSYTVQNEKNSDLKRDGYERLLSEMPQSVFAPLWSLEYLGLFDANPKPAPKKEKVEKVLEKYSEILKNPNLDLAGFPKSDLLQMKAELLAKLGKEAESKKAWAEAAELLGNLAKGNKASKDNRGFNLERAYCLAQSGESEKALKLANEYRKLYPEEFTFHYQVASMLNGDKKYTEALPIAKQAYQYSYGDNKIRAAMLLLKLYATIPDRGSAQQIFESVSKEFAPVPELEIRTHRYLKQMKDLYTQNFK